MKVLQVYTTLESSNEDTIYVKTTGKEWNQLVNYLTEYRYKTLEENNPQKFGEIGKLLYSLDAEYISKDSFNESKLKQEFERVEDI